MIDLGPAEGRHSNVSLTNISFVSQSQATEADQAYRSWKHLSPLHSKPYSHETPHDVGTGLSAVMCDFSWEHRNKFTPEKAPDRAQVRERVLPEFNLASQ